MRELTYQHRQGAAIFSGPGVDRDKVAAALTDAGFPPVPEGIVLRWDDKPHDDHGLASYPSPEHAAKAGVPNAGHTPGTPHPATGKQYVHDPRVAFITVPMPDHKRGKPRPLDAIAKVVTGASNGWGLRLHTSPSLHAQEVDPNRDDMIAVRQELDMLRREAWVKGPDGAFKRLPPPIAGGTANNPPAYMQAGSHSAQLFRQAISTLLPAAGGVVAPGGLAVTQNGTPNMSVNVAGGVPNGQVWVPGTSSALVQALYYCYNDAAVNLAISGSNPTNPRIDTVIAQVQDAAYAGSTNAWQLAVVTGTPTSGANLSNLNGKGSVPASSYVVQYVLVPANATTITTADLTSGYVATVAGYNTAMQALSPYRQFASAWEPTIGTSTTIFQVTVPGITFPTACTRAWISFAMQYGSGGPPTTATAVMSMGVRPNGTGVQASFGNNTGAQIIPVIDVIAEGY